MIVSFITQHSSNYLDGAFKTQDSSARGCRIGHLIDETDYFEQKALTKLADQL